MLKSWSKSRWFLFVSILVLLGTCLFWSFLSYRLQSNNADQLIDGYLFDSWRTFTNASFPSAHSFLLKWPLFAIAAAFNNSDTVLAVLTIFCALSPVAALAFLLSRIERRPHVLGLWFLSLSTMLLLVPAQPSPGTLLPVNFAMFTTRNLEYAVFITILALLTNVKSWRSISAWVAGVLAVILMASDGIFMPLFVGALGLLLMVRVKMFKQIALWFGVVVGSYIAAAITLKLLQYFYITGFSGGAVTPYGLAGGIHTLLQAAAYGALGIGTLFGANPAYAHLSLDGLQQVAIHNVQSVAGIGYVVNAALLLTFSLLTIFFLLTFRSRQGRAPLLAVMTLGAALASAGIYALTDHYYPVDSRYLAIWFFALILCAAVALRSMQVPRILSVLVGTVLLTTVPVALWGSWQQYTQSRDALQPRQAFAESVVSEVSKHGITAIVGDYWDVAPVRQATGNTVQIVPLNDCTAPQQILSSSVWQKRAHGPVAYLLNAQPYQSGFPTCDEANVTSYFGAPDTIVSVQSHAKLLIYKDGMQHILRPKVEHQAVKKSQLPLPTDCDAGRLLQVVAHEDDDLLFMNPDLQHSVDAGQCITTVYVTAGDAGNGENYANGRLAGAQAAYTYIYNGSSKWTTVKKQFNGRTVTVATMENQPRLLLLFLNLPDGNLQGNGFTGSNHASLERLRHGDMSRIQPIEGQGSYTNKELVGMLTSIMRSFKPSEVRTQNYNPNLKDGDHSDHHAVGQLTTQAFRNYNADAALYAYAGYPVRKLAQNVDGIFLAAKEGAFFAYAGYDRQVCDSVLTCYEATAYGQYLPRQYSRLVAQNTYVPSKPFTAHRPTPAKPQPLPQRRDCQLGGTPYTISCPLKPLTNLAY